MGIDYMWMMSNEDEEKGTSVQGMPILVMADQESVWTNAWVVPEKGDHWYSSKVLETQLAELGYKRVIIRSGQVRS